MAGFDLHIHSTASDGAWAPSCIVSVAKSVGLDGIALTDHDTFDGIPEALKAAEEIDFPLIWGVEISAEYKEKDIHILGYWADMENEALISRLKEMREGRLLRCREIVSRLAALGMPLDAETIISGANGSVGRPHIAKAMIDAGYVKTIREAFQKWLSRGMPAYVPRPKLGPDEAIYLIRKAGGAAVIAHPGKSVPDVLIDPLIRCGVVGIEVYHPDHNRRMEQKYLACAKRYRLAVTGGSDFHANSERGIGFKTTPLAQIARLAELK